MRKITKNVKIFFAVLPQNVFDMTVSQIKWGYLWTVYCFDTVVLKNDVDFCIIGTRIHTQLKKF